MAVAIWEYRETTPTDVDLTGFAVEATDGEIGKVDRATHETGSSWIVVDTGEWIVGDKVLLPAGTIERIDDDDGTVYVDRTREEIKNAPPYDPTGYKEQEYLIRLADYYGRFYG